MEVAETNIVCASLHQPMVKCCGSGLCSVKCCGSGLCSVKWGGDWCQLRGGIDREVANKNNQILLTYYHVNGTLAVVQFYTLHLLPDKL